VNNEKTSIDAGDGSAGISDAPAPLVSAELPAAEAGTGIPGAGEAETGPTGDAGGAAFAAGGTADAQPAEVPAPVADRYAVRFPPFDGEADLRDGMFSAACTVEFFAARLEYQFGAEMARHSIFSDAIVLELNDFVRRIGERATPEVMAQQLLIRRLRDTTELTTPQRMALEIFGIVARAFHKREDELEAELARRIRPVEPAPPMPIDETTLEPVDGPMETW
jgi:hypothetical protein